MFSDLKKFPSELKMRNPVLFYLGNALLILFSFFLIGFVVCHYSVYEFCHWIKSGKFTFSFAIYAFTLGWYLFYLKDYFSKGKIRLLSWMIAIFVIFEMIVVLIQGWMDSPTYSALHISPSTTHFWVEKLFTLGNLLIFANTGIALYIGMQFFRQIQVEPIDYLWAIRAGFLLFLVSCLLGWFMLIHYGQTLLNPNNLSIPFTHLSTPRNNLLSMHFIGIHLMQLLPILTYYFHRYLGKKFLLSAVVAYSVSSFALILQIALYAP